MPPYGTASADGADKKELSETESEALLAEVRERFDAALEGWREAHAAGDKDMAAVAGDPWNQTDRAVREKLGRPCLALDEIGQYLHQIVNDVRANPIAMKFDPTGPGASEEGAEFYQDKAREIEYRSHAQVAYTTAFENAVQRGYGWVRIKTDYASPRTEEQELCIEDIPDPNSVIADPDAKRPDSSDMKYLFVVESYSKAEFKRRWPRAKIQDFTGDISRSAPAWIKSEDRIQVGEYWKIKTEIRKLGLWQTPDGQLVKLFEDELDKMAPGSTRVQHLRDVEYPTVCQYLTNGVEILERTEWPGKYIPFASCFAKIIYVNEGAGTKRIFLSATRLARDPYMLYCYYRTAQAEVVGRSTKNAAIGYEGQFRGHELTWQESVHQPMAYLEAKAITEATGSQILPLPTFNNWEPPIQALEMGAEGARRAIQAAMMGSPLPTQAQRQNEKSGVALQKMESSRQKGSFHFYDHYRDMVRHVGVMLEDLMPAIYDTARDVGTRQANDTAKSVRINDPSVEKPVSTAGEYLTTVSTGPSHDSQREAASDFADTLAQNPQVFPIIASDLVKLKNLGPIGDEISEKLKFLQPPEMRAKDQEGQGPDPQQLQAENAQLKQQLQQASQIIQTEQHKQQGQIQVAQIGAQVKAQAEQMSLQAEAQKVQAQIQAEMQRAQMDGEIKLRIAAMDNQTRVQIEEMKLRGTLMQAEIDANEAALNRASGVQQQQAEQGHDANMAERGHEQAMMQGEQGHMQAMESGEMGHAQQLEAQQAAAEQSAAASDSGA